MKWNSSIWVFFLVFCLPGIYAQKVPDKSYLQGLAYYHSGKSDSALISFRQNISGSHVEAESYLYSGLILLKNNNTEAAIKEFESLEKMQKGKGSYYLAKAYARVGNLNKSLEYLEIHLKSAYKLPESKILLDPDFEKFENNQVWIKFWNEGNFYSNYDKAIAEANYFIGNDDYLAALDVINDGIERGYRKSPMLEKRAEIYLLLENKKLALIDLNEAISTDRRNPDLLKTRGEINYDLKKYKLALEDFESAISYNPSDIEIYVKRAKALQKNGQIENAIKDMDFYLSFFPEDDNAYYIYGKIYMDEGLYLDALKYMNKAIKINNTVPLYYLARGESYFNARTYKYADNDLSMALDLDPSNADVYFLKGLTNIKLSDKDHACYCFGKAFELGKKEAYDELGKHCPEFFK